LEVHATTAKWLGLEPASILMVACHNFDLNAAHKAGITRIASSRNVRRKALPSS
jgi:methionine salvage enolase-phosphatase E1